MKSTCIIIIIIIHTNLWHASMLMLWIAWHHLHKIATIQQDREGSDHNRHLIWIVVVEQCFEVNGYHLKFARERQGSGIENYDSF